MKEKIKQKKIKWIISILLYVMLLGLIGVTFAWYRDLQQLNTVALVQIPSRITLSGANRSELQRISLELTADDVQEGNQVTIRRVFCVESTENFWLEVARTTNIENMVIQIYPVKAENSDKTSGLVKGTDGVETFYYTPDDTYLNGDYINQVENETIAIQKDDSGTLHAENYDDGDAVQQNAEPLYWRTDQAEVYNREEYSKPGTVEDEGIDIYYRYYVLQLSWDTSAQETDLVYLLASH
ncbi:MAG: hypothetical protein ACI4TA_01155 [Acetatifactor sp.]